MPACTMEGMEVAISTVAFEEKAVLRRLLELYLHDFSEFDGADVNEHGEYGYRYLDHYFAEEEGAARQAYFIRVDGRLAGFAMVRHMGDRWSMAEFFVMQKYRRAGIGMQAALDVIARHPGAWEIHEIAANLPAQAFWRRVADTVSAGRFEESILDGDVVQWFTAVDPGSAPR